MYSVPSEKTSKPRKMKKNSTTLLTIVTLMFLSFADAQTTSPKLKFVSPVLVSGTAGQKHATYKFSNVINGVNAFVKIENIKNGAVLVNIDDSTLGYYNAWQPVIGGPGTGTSYIKWAIEFKTSDGHEYKFPILDLTAVDVDGDNVRVREFIDMNGESSSDVPTIIPSLLKISNSTDDDNENGDDDNEENLHTLGPVTNRSGIDTASLDVKMNFHFKNKSKFKVSLGSQIDDNGTTGAIATDRYSSLYFMSTSNTLIVLPVSYTAFDATISNDKVNISWITELETKNKHFEIERSFDQSTFSTIAVILGSQPVGIANQYGFVDASAQLSNHKVIYYRLKQIDFNGEFTYSAVKMVRTVTVTKASAQIFPNPFMEKLNVNFVSDASGKAEVRLINAAGNIVKVVTSSITKGFNTVQLQDLNSQSPGVYIANIINNGQVVASLKVLKQ